MCNIEILKHDSVGIIKMKYIEFFPFKIPFCWTIMIVLVVDCSFFFYKQDVVYGKFPISPMFVPHGFTWQFSLFSHSMPHSADVDLEVTPTTVILPNCKSVSKTWKGLTDSTILLLLHIPDLHSTLFPLKQKYL